MPWAEYFLLGLPRISELRKRKVSSDVECFLRVSSLCPCPADPADRTPASCACCATPAARTPSASRSASAHENGTWECVTKKKKPSQWVEFAHVFRTTRGKGKGSKHKRCASLNFPSGSCYWKMTDDVSAVCAAQLLQRVVFQQAALTTRWKNSWKISSRPKHWGTENIKAFSVQLLHIKCCAHVTYTSCYSLFRLHHITLRPESKDSPI